MDVTIRKLKECSKNSKIETQQSKLAKKTRIKMLKKFTELSKI